MIKYCESLPASKSFVFGERDAEFFQRVDENAKPKLYGSPSYFEGRAFQNPKGKKVVYFVSPLLGNHWPNTTDFSSPGPDGIELWHRHREIITFFSKMKGWQLVIKIHPGIKVMMGEPIAEYIQDHYWDNVTIDIYSESNTTYFSSFNCLVFDYPETSFLKALAMQHQRIILFSGNENPGVSPLKDFHLLQKICPVVDSAEACLKVISQLNRDDQPLVNAEMARRFYQLYGGTDKPIADISRLVCDLWGFQTLSDAQGAAWQPTVG